MEQSIIRPLFFYRIRYNFFLQLLAAYEAFVSRETIYLIQ